MTAAPATAVAAANNTLLTVEHLTMRCGGLVAVEEVTFEAKRRQITGVIVPNGAGKTTLFNCITGFYKPTTGRISLHQEDGGAPFLLEQMDGFRIGRDICWPSRRN